MNIGGNRSSLHEGKATSAHLRPLSTWHSAPAKTPRPATAEGKEYIDFGSGIGVNSAGLRRRSVGTGACPGRLPRCSTLPTSITTRCPHSFAAELLPRLPATAAYFWAIPARRQTNAPSSLRESTAWSRYGDDHCEILTLQNSFHGRTVTTLAATGQDVFHHYFFPFTGGFVYAEAEHARVCGPT